MITSYKIFESLHNHVLLITEPHSDYYRKFTYGKLYKLYDSGKAGLRLKDDNGKFDNLWIHDVREVPIIFTNGARYSFTRDKSIEAYKRRLTQQQFDL